MSEENYMINLFKQQTHINHANTYAIVFAIFLCFTITATSGGDLWIFAVLMTCSGVLSASHIYRYHKLLVGAKK